MQIKANALCQVDAYGLRAKQVACSGLQFLGLTGQRASVYQMLKFGVAGPLPVDTPIFL